MCLLEVDLRPSWTAKCVEACALALGAPPCLHKLVQLMVCPLPSCMCPSSLLVHPQTHSAHHLQECLRPPWILAPSYTQVHLPSMNASSNKCTHHLGCTLHESLHPLCPRRLAPTLVRPPLLKNAPKCAPNPHSLFLFTPLLLTQISQVIK
jgi:hypothetical protein